MTRRRIGLLAGLLTCALAACGGDGGSRQQGAGARRASGTEEPAGKGRIVIGTKVDTEAKLLGTLMAQVLRAKGYEVETKIGLGSTDLVRKALLSGDIDVYWEFTSSGLNLLGQSPIGDPGAAYARVKELDAANGVTWLPAATMNDTYALAVKDGGPVEARTLTELAARLERDPDKTRLCADPEGGFREDVLPAVEREYGLTFPRSQQVGSALIPEAVAGGQCEVGIVYSTTALVVKHALRVLDDDRRAFGAYTPAPVLRTKRLADYPGLESDLAALTAALDTPTITALNARVDVEGVTLDDAAGAFLRDRALA